MHMRIGLLFAVAAVVAIAAPPDSARLAEAAKAGNTAQALALLDQKADPNSAELDGTTALHWAVRNNDLDLATRLLAAGADAKAANRYGITPLYLAAQNGSAEMIAKLLDAGADPNSTINLGETALMTAARTGVVNAAKVLLDHGAKVDAREQWHGETALMYATVEHHPGMMRLLIEHGADVNAKTDLNEWERQTTSEPREKWLPLGAMTPLLFAAREGCVECASVLIDAGADIQVQDPHGVSAPLMAIINGHYDVAGLLIDRGADPNLADDTGRTALFSAIDFNTVPQSNRPAPPGIIENKLTALDLAAKLIEHGADVNAQLSKQQPYRVKLDRGDDTMLSTGTTPLLRAAKAADLDAMKLLLAHGADVTLATGRAGITPLLAAAGDGSKEEDTTGRFKTEDEMIAAIQMLTAAGAKIDETDSQGQTALWAAAKWGYDKVVQFLADQGVPLDAKNARGFTALDAALGLAGGSGGFDGSRRDVHQSTADLLTKLMQTKGIVVEPRLPPEGAAPAAEEP